LFSFKIVDGKAILFLIFVNIFFSYLKVDKLKLILLILMECVVLSTKY